jgi:hypothetical protein
MGGRAAGCQFIAGAEVLMLSYRTVVHIVQFVVGGFHPYSWALTWLAVYFTLADPLAAALLFVTALAVGRRVRPWLRRAG